jgi:uncharacterized protein (TIGR02145 family)
MAENLDWKWEGLQIGGSYTAYTTPHAWYYNNDEATYGVNGNKYGLLYNGYALRNLADGLVDGLPSGWRVASYSDYSTLISFVGSNGGTKLKSTSGWNSDGNGTDEFGYNCVPSGAVITTSNPGSRYLGEENLTYISNDYQTWYGGVFVLRYNSNSAEVVVQGASKQNALSIRLVKTLT